MVGRLPSNKVIRYFLMLDRIYYTKHGPTAPLPETTPWTAPSVDLDA